ncbi:MAG TPA: hypothetical protein VKY32_05035 [Flavobacterium sp.]|nr:hypothetical protein [Flavobacterium sp.]
MKTIALSILFLFFTQIGSAQNDEKAIQTSKNVLTLIKQKKYNQFLQTFEEKRITEIEAYQERVGEDYLQKTVDYFNESLTDNTIDFKNFEKKVLTPIEGESELIHIVYQFPMTSKNDEKAYFEISFLAKNNFEKIFSVDVVKVQKMPNVEITYGAEKEEIPEPGEVIIDNYEDSGFIKSIKYIDFFNLITINFDQTQNKTEETIFPLDNLTKKTVTAYHNNGNIRLIATYDQGIVNGNFTRFYENGKLCETGFYGAGLKKEGSWHYFDEQGNLTKTEIYEQGKLIQPK